MTELGSLLPAGYYPVSHPMDSTVGPAEKHRDRPLSGFRELTWLTSLRTTCKIYHVAFAACGLALLGSAKSLSRKLPSPLYSGGEGLG